MKPEHKNFLKTKLRERLGRDPKESEEINAETDALLLIQLLEQRVEDLENILKK